MSTNHQAPCRYSCHRSTGLAPDKNGPLVLIESVAPLIAALLEHQDLTRAPFGDGIDHDHAVRALRTLLPGAPS